MTSRKLEVIGEHTVDVSLLTPGGWVLDAGCRDFVFARGLAQRGCEVVALDADPMVTDPDDPHIAFYQVALAATAGVVTLMMTPDPQARHLSTIQPSHVPSVQVSAYTVGEIMRYAVGLDDAPWDVVKLDIEGAEYDILHTWPGPIARQISVEFHEHVRPRPQHVYDEIFHHLSKWYEVTQHEKSARHCCAPNFWDTLLILRETA